MNCKGNIKNNSISYSSCCR